MTNQNKVTFYKDIDYKDLPKQENSIETHNSSSTITHEEVKNYEILNVVTEEITMLSPAQEENALKKILGDSLLDHSSITSSKNILPNSDITSAIDAFTSDYSKAFVHNIEDFSYIEIVDQGNNTYNLHMQGEELNKLNSNDLDTILINLIEKSNLS